MIYRFETTTTMKECNRGKYWISGDLIPAIEIHADDMKTALNKYRVHVNTFWVDISDNALRNPVPMYHDDTDGNTRQIGYVITGSTEIENERGHATKQFIDLWVSVKLVTIPNFKEV